jgi:hypothetical protein
MLMRDSFAERIPFSLLFLLGGILNLQEFSSDEKMCQVWGEGRGVKTGQDQWGRLETLLLETEKNMACYR